MTTVATQKPGAKKSPFTVSLETEIQWSTMTSREKPLEKVMLDTSDVMKSFCEDLAHIGLIGSVQALNIYLRRDKGKLNKATELGLIKKHTVIRGKKEVPVYTLGAGGMYVVSGDLSLANYWKTYDKFDVLRRLVFFQLYKNLKENDDKVSIIPSEGPFVGGIRRNGKDFHILVLRGNENEINQLFRYEADRIPQRILLVAEEFNHVKPIQDNLKPYANQIRLTTDTDLNEPFENMFYHFNNNVWQKEFLK